LEKYGRFLKQVDEAGEDRPTSVKLFDELKKKYGDGIFSE